MIRIVLSIGLLVIGLAADVGFKAPTSEYSLKDAVVLNLNNSVYLYSEIIKEKREMEELKAEITRMNISSGELFQELQANRKMNESLSQTIESLKISDSALLHQLELSKANSVAIKKPEKQQEEPDDVIKIDASMAEMLKNMSK